MFSKIVAAAALASAFAVAPAQAYFIGNDTGGIIPWSPEAERQVYPVAQAHCAWYGKEARITSIDRKYGQYMAFACLFPPPYAVRGAIRTKG